MPPHGVDLIDEDDAGRVRLSLLEEVPDARRSHTHEHFHEVRSGHLEERAAGLSRHGLGQEGLPRTGRPHQEHAFREPSTEAGELLRILEELDDLVQLFLGLVGACHVGECDLRCVRRDQLGLGSAELEGPVPATLHGPEDPDPEDSEHHPGQDGEQDGQEAGALRLGGDDHVLLLEIGDLLGLDGVGEARGEGSEVLPFPREGGVELPFHLVRAHERHRVDVPSTQLLPELGVVQLHLVRVLGPEHLKGHHRHEGHEDPERERLGSVVPSAFLRRLVGRLICHACS